MVFEVQKKQIAVIKNTVFLLLACSLFFTLVACDGQSKSQSDNAKKNDLATMADLSPQENFLPIAIENFKLLDHHGDAHELFYYDDAAAIVVMIHGNGCPVVRNALPDYQALAKKYSDKNVRFFLLNSNLQDNRASILKEAGEWAVNLPILIDDDQLIGESLGLTRTAEVFVIDPTAKKIVYRGPLNDRISYESQKEKAGRHFVKDALIAHLSGQVVTAANQPVKGCLINFSDRSAVDQNISYVENIAPILKKTCVSCHREGGIAPWSMSSFDMVKGFAPMIREVVRLKRMPPWHADPEVGHWLEDRSLSIADRQTLVHWIEAGALRGEGDDPLLDVSPASNAWDFGEPDLELDVPAFAVPASGLVKYQFPHIDNPLDRDVWVTAVAVKPGDPKALHHMYAGVSAAKDNEKSVTDNYLVAWSPGSNLGKMAKGTAVLLPKDSRITFEMHYTPYGRISIDRTKIALYFSDKPPDKILRYSEVLNHKLRIPAGERNYLDRAYHEFERDAHLYTLIPHSHYRGKSSQFILQYPDGDKRLLLSVPYYDFNWQIGYSFVEPLAVPAGSRLIHQTMFDNSKYNDRNPDPNRDVFWGLQAEDEMLFGPFIFTWDDESPAHITHNSKRLIYSRRMGFLDRDMDGYIEFEELPQQDRREFYPLFHRGDKDGDKKLTHSELMSAIE